MASRVQVLEVLKAEGAVSVTVEALYVARKLIATISVDVLGHQIVKVNLLKIEAT